MHGECQDSLMGNQKSKSVVFYDGECGLCQRSIAFLCRIDRQKKLLFAPLNGITYQAIFPDNPSRLESVVFYHQGSIFLKSDAIIETMIFLGGLKKLLVLARVVPVFLRNGIYDFVAGHRRKVSCVILHKDQRFLK
jgi:predicted DCC family thiol-disulfide oxidoreductase YuxK